MPKIKIGNNGKPGIAGNNHINTVISAAENLAEKAGLNIKEYYQFDNEGNIIGVDEARLQADIAIFAKSEGNDIFEFESETDSFEYKKPKRSKEDEDYMTAMSDYLEVLQETQENPFDINEFWSDTFNFITGKAKVHENAIIGLDENENISDMEYLASVFDTFGADNTSLDFVS